LQYAALGWSGYVPEQCRDTTLLIPINVAGWLWGWPNRFLDRMDAAGTQMFLLGPYGGGFSEGLDDPELIKTFRPAIPAASPPTRSTSSCRKLPIDWLQRA
jgi:glycerophosphoryl diester phosphodiesterase